MTSQLNNKIKYVIMLNMFIGNYSGIRKFLFGILIIMIHRFMLYMQWKWGNQKNQLIIARHIIHVTSLI